MSKHHSAPRAEPDTIHSRKVVAVGVSALTIFALAILAVWMGYVGLGGRAVESPESVPPEAGRNTIAMVIQAPYYRTQATPAHEAQRKRLHSYGWLDRASGTIHIPIDRAMQLLLEEQANR